MSFGRKIIKVIDSTINYIILFLFLLLFAYGCYALWDARQIYQEADSAQYEIYKPTEEERLSFEELQKLNSEVFGWITVYGTNIDYPLVQGEDNEKYINTNAKGEFSLSGSIFLDYRNKKDFSDYNHIIYGHHMERAAMFGELGSFVDKDFFDQRQYGNLYANDRNYGLEFFAFLQVDAYDTAIYTPAVQGKEKQQSYLDELLGKAMYQRDIGITTDDPIVLLSTCTTNVTNGRQILLARITDETYENPFAEEASVELKNYTYFFWILLGVTLFLLLLVIFLYYR